MIRRFVRDESGMTLALAVMMVLLVGVMGAGLLTFVMTDLQSVIEENRGQKAMDAAETGVQVAQAHLGGDSYRQHYDTLATNDCESGSGWRTGSANWSKATQSWSSAGNTGQCESPATLVSNPSDNSSTPWPEQYGVTKCFPNSNCSAAGTGRFHVTIECYVGQLDVGSGVVDQNGITNNECSGGVTGTPPENVPASDRKFFRITSTGYDNATGNGAIRKIEAIYYTAKKGHLPIAYWTPGNINFDGGIQISKLSFFAGKNISGTVSGGNSIAQRCTEALYRDWHVEPYNDVGRVATSDPCPAQPAPPEGANAITGAGFGALGLVCADTESQCDAVPPLDTSDSNADGRNDFDSTTGSKGMNRTFIRKTDPRGPLGTSEISFPFDPGTSLDDPSTVIGPELAEEMAIVASKQNNYVTVSNGRYGGDNCAGVTHCITSWPGAPPPASDGSQDIITYVVDGMDVEYSVSANKVGGTCPSFPKGLILVRNGNFRFANSLGLCGGFEGLVIVIGDGTTTGNYISAGGPRHDGYVTASGTMTIRGDVNPNTTIDYTNLLKFYDTKLWSWRELYQ